MGSGTILDLNSNSQLTSCVTWTSYFYIYIYLLDIFLFIY